MLRRGDVYFADLDPSIGCEEKGSRPVLLIQNDVGNKYSPTVIVTMITSSSTKKKLPTHVSIKSGTCGLFTDSVIMLEQIRTIDKSRLKEQLGHADDETMKQIDNAALHSLGIKKYERCNGYVMQR